MTIMTIILPSLMFGVFAINCKEMGAVVVVLVVHPERVSWNLICKATMLITNLITKDDCCHMLSTKV
jgi:hypothetical protein